MKRSISIINTEIQLINVIEALQHFECNDNCLVIGQFNLKPERIKKIEKMLEEPLFRQHFNKIVHLPLYLSGKNPLRFIGYILAYIKFFFFVLFSKKFDCCFFGVMTDIMVKPIAYLAYYRNPDCMLCVIDEGVRVMEDARIRVQNVSQVPQKQRKRNLFCGYFLAITRKWSYPAVTYFTIYQLPLLPQDSLVNNDYHFFKTHKFQISPLSDNAVVIVGQPLVELEITTAETYHSIISRIVSAYSDHTIYYAPHPIENSLDQLSLYNIQILRTQYPLELVLMTNNIFAIIGFSSTALLNSAYLKLCQNIFSIDLNDEDYFRLLDKEKMKELNQQMMQHGIRILQSENLNEPIQPNVL